MILLYCLIFFIFPPQTNCKDLIDVTVASFGGVKPFFGVATLTFSAPTFELAVEELNRKYGTIFNFTYVFSQSRVCLSMVNTPDDILAKWFYQQQSQAPERIIHFVTTGSEAGNSCILHNITPKSARSNFRETRNRYRGSRFLPYFWVVCKANETINFFWIPVVLF
jgi:hypothetical protein